MMTLLREKTGMVLWVVIFAFIGLIVVEWGADYSGPGQEDVGDAVGVVNGQTISLKDFQGALRQLARQTPEHGMFLQTSGAQWIARLILTSLC